MSCPTCGSVACPEPVATVNVEENTVDAESTVAIVVSNTNPSSAFKRLITMTVADAGYWLIRVTMFSTATPSNAEFLNPPAKPGISQFFKVTDAAGISTFEVDTEGVTIDQFWIGATLVGPIVMTSAHVFA